VTIGELRVIIKDLRDDVPVCIDWALGEAPRDHEPGVKLFGWDVEQGNLVMRVGLFYLDELSDEQDFEITEDDATVG
jgi:hypothetical protein